MRPTRLIALLVLSGAVAFAGCGDKDKKKDKDDDKKPADSATATATATGAASSAAPPPANPPPASTGEPVAAPTGSGTGDAAVPDAPSQPFIEEHEEGQLAWRIEPEGDVSLGLADKDAKAVDATKSSGTLKIKGKETKLEAKDGQLTGNIGKLEDALTTVEYTVKVPIGGTKTWKGVLHLPPGGTADLAAAPHKDDTIKEGTKGPNGGIVDVVGGHRIEIVQDGKSGQVRVYFLNDKNEVMPAPKGVKLRLGIQK